MYIYIKSLTLKMALSFKAIMLGFLVGFIVLLYAKYAGYFLDYDIVELHSQKDAERMKKIEKYIDSMNKNNTKVYHRKNPHIQFPPSKS